MSLRLATFNVENLMNRFDFSGYRNQLNEDRTLALFDIQNEAEYRLLEQARTIAQSDAFQIFVQGLSDGNHLVTPPGGGEPTVLYKTLRIDFARPGDERNFNEREIRLMDPPYEWVYY